VTEPNGHVCPECAAPRAPDGTPSCACTQRASDALRDARTAEAAAAEDFDPLRIRPYVELGDVELGDVELGAGDSEGSGSAGTAPTLRLSAVPAEPRAADVRAFHEAPPPEPPPEPGPSAVAEERPRRQRRRQRLRQRRAAVVGAAGAVGAVVAAAGITSGLFSYDAPARDRALPEGVRASVPEVSPGAASGSSSESASSAAAGPTVPAPSHSASASPSPSASASASSASAAPSRSVTPTQTQAPTTAVATGSLEATGDGSNEPRGQETLRRGDRGPDVAELQLRLRQLSLYTGADNGKYDNHVEDAVRRYQWARGITADELGVYGGATRTSLEAETTEP